ncbi:MAG: sensor histidine kinase [Verrucomicrobiota bacterium]
MLFPLIRLVVLLSISTGVTSYAFNNYSDPLSPDELDEASDASRPWIFSIPERLNGINAEIEVAESVLSSLPDLKNATQYDAYGYHSDYLPALEEAPEEPRWVIEMETGAVGGSLNFVMVPSVDRRGDISQSYGFPRRFRLIEILVNGKEKILVDWSKEDFPNPGIRPVYFDIPELVSKRLRLEVFRGQRENDIEFFALARILCIRKGEVQIITDIEASSSFEAFPYWSINYLREGRSALGPPLASRTSIQDDFVLRLENPEENHEIVVELDFQENVRDGWIHLYPAQFSSGVTVPGFGFPRRVGVEIVEDDGQGGYGRVSQLLAKRDYINPGDNLMRLPWRGLTGRWLRVTFSDFPVYQGQSYFALGEIVVERRGNRDSAEGDVKVTLDGEPIAENVERLADELVGGVPVMLTENWLRGLAAAKPIEANLSRLQAEQNELEGRWAFFWRSTILVAVLLLVLVVCFLIFWQIHIRRKEIKRLRLRIARDLHDEVGSNLGSISLTAERLESDIKDPSLREELMDLLLLSREAVVSLRDVIWVTDQSTLYLDDLIDKLVDRARKVLSAVELSVDTKILYPRMVLSLRAKRHLIMFFKEVIHNCARHSKAEKVWLKIHASSGNFSLTVLDNGVGFKESRVEQGWGLESLRKRARELGGSLNLESATGKGTTISLELPLQALRKSRNHGYNTSNE